MFCNSNVNKTFLVSRDREIITVTDQVYSNTRVPTQVNTNQHESARINTSLTRVNTSPTRVNTSPTRVNTSPTQVNTNQHKLKSVLVEVTRVNTSPTRV